MSEEPDPEKYVEVVDSYIENWSESSDLTRDINKSGEYRCIWYVGIAGYSLLNFNRYLKGVLEFEPTGAELFIFSLPWFMAIVSGVITLWLYGLLQEKDSLYYMSKKGNLFVLRLRLRDKKANFKEFLDLISEKDKTSETHKLHQQATSILWRVNMFDRSTFLFLGIGFLWAGLGGFLYGYFWL